MRINDKMIREWAESGGIDPFDPECINPASIDLRWSGRVRVARKDASEYTVAIDDFRDPKKRESALNHLFHPEFTVDEFSFMPGRFVRLL